MKKYLVGGAVRDKLLGRPAKDNDWVLVGATNEDVQLLIDNGFEQVGADFPVFLHPETKEEWALARSERKTGPGYLGFEVNTEGVTLEDDLLRRDLTMNSIAFDPSMNAYIDPYGGIQDIIARRVKHTSPAFSEDPLRVLRVARLAARYDFSIHSSTAELCKKLVQDGRLNELPTERFFAELQKAMSDTTKHNLVFAVFMSHLESFGVFNHVNYFKGWSRTLRYFFEIMSAELSDRERLCMYLGNQGAAGVIREARVYEWIFAGLSGTRPIAERVMSILGATHVWSTEAPNYQALMNVVHLNNDLFMHKLLKMAVQAVQEVKADQFTETGPALGAAIKAERFNRVQRLTQELSHR